MSNLVNKLFAIASLGAGLSACASVKTDDKCMEKKAFDAVIVNTSSTTWNKDCDWVQVAKAAISSDQDGMVAFGLNILKIMQPKIVEPALQATVKELITKTEQKWDCQVTGMKAIGKDTYEVNFGQCNYRQQPKVAMPASAPVVGGMG